MILIVLQTFVTMIIGRFQSINPNKEGNNVKGIADIKHEITIMTLEDDHYAMWEEFLTKYTNGDIINPDTALPYKQTKGADKRYALKREFFKPMGHFTDDDLKTYVQHLLGRTPNRTLPYPKVSVVKSKKPILDNYCSSEWVERRKRKKVILEELVNADKSLKFMKDDGSIDREKWRDWKKTSRFSSGTWDFLLATPSSDFLQDVPDKRGHEQAGGRDGGQIHGVERYVQSLCVAQETRTKAGWQDSTSCP